jgi:hypothetical protein
MKLILNIILTDRRGISSSKNSSNGSINDVGSANACS